MADVVGGCLCGKIRYGVNGTPKYAGHCHCSMCRKASGAPLVTWMTIKLADLEFTEGAPKYFDSSSKAERSFCPDCGTSLTYRYKAIKGEIDIAVATLDDPDRFKPSFQVWTRDRLAYMKDFDDSLTSFRERPE